jgi:hypothetical protein
MYWDYVLCLLAQLTGAEVGLRARLDIYVE